MSHWCQPITPVSATRSHYCTISLHFKLPGRIILDCRNNSPIPIYTHGWRETGIVREICLALKHNDHGRVEYNRARHENERDKQNLHGILLVFL